MTMENHKEIEVLQDWSNMPIDMLEEFCKRLTISNQVRFSIVCKTWLSANTSNKAYNWIPGAPWLISKEYINAQFQVISITDNQAYKIYKPFKPLLGTSIIGSSNGWLVLRSGFKLFILNLFLKLHLDLPLLNAVSCLPGSIGDYYFHMPFAFAISTCPKMNPTSVASVTYNGYLGWCKIGDTTWKRHHTSDMFYANVAFHNDKLYAVDRDGEKVNMFKYDEGVLVQVGRVESTKSSQQSPLYGPISKRVYLVESGGRVLVVRRITDDTKLHRPTLNFVISVVEENSSMPQLVKVQSLDNHILFMANSSIECLDAKYCPEFQHDCVYFTCLSENSITPKVGEFSVANGTILIRSAPLTSSHMQSMQSPVWMLPRFPFDCECEECTSAPWITLKENEEKTCAGTCVA